MMRTPARDRVTCHLVWGRMVARRSPGATMTDQLLVPVTDHSFGVFDKFEIPIATASWGTGLIVEMAVGAMIYTGIDRGPVRVTVDIRDAAPSDVDREPWDDIVEASLTAPHGQLRIQPLEYVPQADPSFSVPLLSFAGPGTYRLRAHTRGRDTAYDTVQTEPCEDYLLTIWPAPPQPSLIIRATDKCGYGVRLADLTTPKRTLERQPPGYQAQQQRNAELDAALLQSRPDRVE